MERADVQMKEGPILKQGRSLFYCTWVKWQMADCGRRMACKAQIGVDCSYRKEFKEWSVYMKDLLGKNNPSANTIAEGLFLGLLSRVPGLTCLQ